jgi:uncharacterized DUF497 family protein
MGITYNAEKREWTLEERRLDFEDAIQVFAGTAVTVQDDRRDYGEVRYQTFGVLNERVVMVVWTPRARTATSFQ